MYITMKKAYIQPEVVCCTLQVERMMAVSGQTNDNPASVATNGDLNNEVKRNDYNVWDDDWSR